MSRFREWDLSCKVYVGNLGSSASKYEIERVFSKYGPIKNVWVARNPPGFAFVEFEDSRDAEDSVRGLDGTRCCGTRIRVEMSSGRTRRDGRRCHQWLNNTISTTVPPPSPLPPPHVYQHHHTITTRLPVFSSFYDITIVALMQRVAADILRYCLPIVTT